MFRSFAAAKSCHECLQERQPNGAHSFYALFQQVFGRGTFQTDFSWCVDRQDKPTDSARHTRKSRTHLWLPAWWLDWSLVAGLSWHCPHNDVGAVQIVSWRLHFTIFHLRVFRGQEKHGHAVNTQGACSQICCGESPRALGQRVPLGDRKTATLEPSAKHKWSCGSGVSVLCSSKVMPWVFARTPTERGSLFLCPLPTGVWQRHVSNRFFLMRR